MAKWRKLYLLQFAKIPNQQDSIYDCLTNLKSGELEQLQLPKLDQIIEICLGKTNIEKNEFWKICSYDG